MNWWLELVERGCMAIDVGANVGDITALLSDAVGQEGTVLAIEPGPALFDLLEQRSEKWMNVRPLRIAVGDRSGHARLFHYDSWTLLPVSRRSDPGIDAGLPYRLGHPNHLKGEFEVEMLTLDEIISRYASGWKVRFVKIDTDGAEERILDGAQELLRQSRPVLHVELNHINLGLFGDSSTSLLWKLHRWGYGVVHDNYGVPLPAPGDDMIRRLSGDDMCADIVCIPVEHPLAHRFGVR